MMKVLIKVISVMTLVFGTCYQSVLALADDTRRVTFVGAQLTDDTGARPSQVKLDDKQTLALTVTVTNKDGDHRDGETGLWLPEDQLDLLKQEATATVEDTNAKLIMERRRNKQLRLRWRDVEGSATFKLELPVTFKQTMMSMALPIAVGSQTKYLQSLNVVAADTDDADLAQAGQGESLPGDTFAALDQFIQSQKLQEANQSADAVEEEQKTSETDSADKASSESTTEKKKTQDSADQAKETEKTKQTLKNNSQDASKEDDTDAAKRETKSKTTKAATDLGTLLSKNSAAADKTPFTKITLRQGTTDYNITAGKEVNVTNLKDFKLIYDWDSESLLEKLNGHEVESGDYYTFKIYGLDEYAGSKSDIIKDDDGVEFARWEVVEKTENGRTYQEVKITFTNEDMNATNVTYQFTLEQKYSGNEPIDFEYGDGAVWTVDPSEEDALLAKSGQFIGDHQIRWTVTMTKPTGSHQFKDIQLDDTLILSSLNQHHGFVDGEWDVHYEGQTDSLRGYFDIDDKELVGGKVKLIGNAAADIEDNLVFTFVTKYEKGTFGTFENQASGQIGDKLTLTPVKADVSSANVTKSQGVYKDGIYSWSADVTVNFEQFGDSDDEKLAALEKLVIVDRLSGTHIFDENTLGLTVTLNGKTVTDLFKTTVSDGQKVLTLNVDATDAELREILSELSSKTEFELKYQTKESGEGAINSAGNKISASIGGNHIGEGSSTGTGGGNLITKSGNHDYTIHEDGNAHIKWTLRLNGGAREFDTLKVIDVLPAGTKLADILDIIVPTGDDLTAPKMTQGSAQPARLGSKNLFTFSSKENKYDRAAIQFEFDDTWSGKSFNITFKTKHDWNSDGEYKNNVGAVINDERYQYSDSTVTVGDRIRNNVYKDGDLKLDGNKPESGKHSVEWSVAVGSRLNDVFGTATGQVDTVTIRDWLNGSGAKYLSFPEEKTDYTLYQMTGVGTRGAKVDTDHYDIDWTDNSKGERTFTITFNEKANDQKYSHLALVYNTKINLSAWEDFVADDDHPAVPATHYFLNNAEVSYDSKTFKEVNAKESLSSTGIYGMKDGESIGNNQLKWTVLFNATSKDLGYPTVTDKLTGNHIHEVNPADFDIAFVGVKHTGEGDSFKVEVDPDVPAVKLEAEEDYTITQKDNQTFTIQFKTKVDRPVRLIYKTTMQQYSDQYRNEVKISGAGQSIVFKKEHTVSSSAFRESWAVRFKKIDGDSGNPLAGATFKLQWKINGEWQDAKRIGDNQTFEPVTSNGEGYVQYHLLGTLRDYRIVETSPPANYNGPMAPIEFNKSDYVKGDWKNKNPEIKNYKVDPANLTISKATTKLTTPKQFKFQVRALNEDGNVNTGFHGKYDLNDQGSVTFDQGISEEITVDAGQKRTILGLPVDQVDQNGNKTKWRYDVRELSESDAYSTKVAVNNAEPEVGKQSKPFTLDPANAQAVTVFFENTAAVGDLEIRKLVSGKPHQGQDEMAFEFTIKASDVDRVANKTFDAEGVLDKVKFDDYGVFKVDLMDNDYLRIKDLPEAVTFDVTEKQVAGVTTTWAVNDQNFGNGATAVTIDAQQMQLVTYKNSWEDTGQIMVTKHISGDVPSSDKFHFEIQTSNGLSGKYSYAKYHADTQKPEGAGQLTFEDGMTTVTLKGNEYIVIDGLPLKTTFLIRELEPDNKHTVTSWETATDSGDGYVTDEMTLNDPNELKAATFTNALPNGDLKLSKAVVSQHSGDQATEFDFAVQADKDSVDRVKNREFTMTGLTGLSQLIFNADGQAKLTLRKDQTAVVTGLPAGVKLQISEAAHPDFTTAYQVENNQQQAGNQAEVTIKDDKQTAVTYTNTRIEEGHLLLEKKAVGTYPTDQDVKFTITTKEQLNREFEGVLTKQNGSTSTRQISFEDGVANVTIQPNESLLIKHLPVDGYRYQVKEADQPDQVETTWQAGDQTGNGLVADDVTLKANNTTDVIYTNSIETGHLTLTKWVASHKDSDKQLDFTYRLQASNATQHLVAGNRYQVSGHDGKTYVTFDENGEATMPMKDQAYVTITGLPVGVELQVRETQTGGLSALWIINNEGDYQAQTAEQTPTVTVEKDQTEVVTYQNQRDPEGSLRVDKIVTGAVTNNRQYEFNVKTAQTVSGQYHLAVYDRQNGDLLHERDLTFDNGDATLKLASDQYAVINGLPLGSYRVSEVDPDIANMTTTWQVNGGEVTTGLRASEQTLTANKVDRVTFTNSLHTGNISLEKQLEGAVTSVDQNREFEFTVTVQRLDDDEKLEVDDSFTGDYTATLTAKDGSQTTSTVSFKKGVLVTHLRASERLQISHLPSELQVVVTETAMTDYLTSHRVNGGQTTPGHETAAMTIADDMDQHVTFINDRPALPEQAWLALTKSVTGEAGEQDRVFSFTIRFLDNGLQPVSGAVNYVKTLATGGYQSGQMLTASDGTVTVGLQHGETIRWQLPNGAHYQITEDDYSAEGYITSVSQGALPERSGLTVTGVVTNTDPAAAKVIYYNHADPVSEDQPHTDSEDDTTVPDFVNPVTDSSSTEATTSSPQAHTSTGTSGSTGSGTKGFLPQTGELLKDNWVIVLGLLILVTVAGLKITRGKKKR